MGDPKHHNDSRRDFIRGSSLLIAGAVPAALASASEASPVAAKIAAAKIGRPSFRLGLVGCGYRGTAAATQAVRCSAANVQIVALADLFGDRLQQACRSLKGNCGDHFQVASSHRLVGFDACRRLLDLDVDVVILATAPGFRPLHFQAAVEAGKHIYAERPVAVDVAGVRTFMEASQAATERGLAVAVGLQRRHTLRSLQTIDQIKSGAIGEITFARAYCKRPAPRKHPRRSGNQSELEFQLRNWQYFNWAGGDSIVEQHVQSLDLMNWALGDHPSEAVGVGGWQASGEPSYGQAFDHHSVEFRYRNGPRLMSMNGWTSGSRGETEEWIHGTEGSCDLTGGKLYDLRNQLIWKAEDSQDGHQNSMIEFFRNLSSGKLPAEGRYAAESTMTAILGRQATYSGKRVRWDDCFASRQQLADFSALKSLKDPVPATSTF